MCRDVIGDEDRRSIEYDVESGWELHLSSYMSTEKELYTCTKYGKGLG